MKKIIINKYYSKNKKVTKCILNTTPLHKVLRNFIFQQKIDNV